MKILPNTIICFHEIHDQNYLNTAVESLLKYYNIISIAKLEDYFYKNENLKNSCHITFDDGDISFYNNAFPVIKKHSIQVSIYVSPLMAQSQKNFWFQEIRGYNMEKLFEIYKNITNNKLENNHPSEIKKFLKLLPLEAIWEIIKLYQKKTNTEDFTSMNMTEKQLIEVKSSGLVEIGAHTLNHPILINETDAIADDEIIGSIDQLSHMLHSEIKYFVYPNGAYGEREINILRNKGIKLAFTTKRDKISTINNPLSIPRSGSPFISELKNYEVYIFSKCLVQLLAGEKRYYKYANTWSSIASNILK